MADCNQLNTFQKFYFPAIVNLIVLTFSFFHSTEAHYIQIDHNEFRASGFPRPHIPHGLPNFEDVPQHLHAKEITASELMTDLTNDLSYRILHFHSILNRNNLAFSPTALMSILVALYEGSAGRSSKELKNVLQLPNNRDIIRVGYRDIHRKLRTYFFGSDNPLKGLSLNKENVTITSEYETILMFYGYDLGMDMVSSTVTPTTTESSVSNETTTVSNDVTEETTIPITEITSTLIIPSTTIAMITETNTESSGTTETPETTETTIEDTSKEGDNGAEELTTEALTKTEETTEPAEVEELVSAFVADADAEPLLRIEKARVSRLPMAKLKAPNTLSSFKTNYLPALKNSNSTNTRMIRQKRHLISYKELESNLFAPIFQPRIPHSLMLPITTTQNLHLTHYDIGLHSQFPPHIEKKRNYNTDIISHLFYLNNQQTIYTTFKVYNAVLYYKYFDSIKMNVIELELDTSEYNLMILLPDFHIDLVTAAASLRVGPSLRLMRKQLKPCWVQAIIPDFKLHGTMFLTNDLQNMGIIDIFEPNRANFGPMTDEKGIYVKHIEQFINVHIRTHPINQLKRNSNSQAQPIQISVNHPFLFFIIDRELDAAVMAGRIINPLNVRIQ